MAARFEDSTIDREGLLSLGYDRESGQFYLSIPAANQMVDYEEYYRLDAEEYSGSRTIPRQRGRLPPNAAPGSMTTG